MRSRFPGRWVHRVHIHLYGWYLAPVTVDEPSSDGGKRPLVIVTCHLASPHGVYSYKYVVVVARMLLNPLLSRAPQTRAAAHTYE